MARATVIIKPFDDTGLGDGIFSIKKYEAIGKAFEAYCNEVGMYRSEVMFSTTLSGMNDETMACEICQDDTFVIRVDLAENEFEL